MSAELLKKEFIPKYISVGEDKFYRSLIFYALSKMILIEQGFTGEVTPDITFIERYEKFLLLYRQEGEQKYLDIARTFRRAAHKIHRVFLKKNKTRKSSRFLHLV